MAVASKDVVADLRQTIAELQRQLDERRAELHEALERQSATADVLRVINSSPGDLASVFGAILEKAHKLCGVAHGSLQLYDGATFRAVAVHGLSQAFADRLRQGYVPGPNMPHRRLLEGGRFAHVADIGEIDDPVARAAFELGGIRTTLFIPLRKDGTFLGQIVAARRDVRPFAEREIALLESFAAQAVIAIENARLLTEQREALERQTATAEVLQVINSSPGELAPVFEAMLEKATRLCDAKYGLLATYDAEGFQGVAAIGLPIASAAALSRIGHPPSGTCLGRVERTNRTAQIADISIEPAYADVFAVNPWLRQVRTNVVVPMLKEGKLAGAFILFREEISPFSDKQIALLQNFAAQAVIAMDNARLIAETREALEQQTATAEVLQVINSSPGDLAPVFDAMLERAMRLCEGAFGGLWTFDGDRYVAHALRGVPPAYAQFLAGTTLIPGPGTAPSRFLQGERSVIQNIDLANEEPYRAGDPQRRALVELGGARTALQVPLCKDNAVLGVMTIYRQEVRPFSDQQITLLQNFAAQAVIAMENARLITETRDALERQTATAEVLQVINSSPGELAPVFEAMLAKATRLCEGTQGVLWTIDGDRVTLAATYKMSPEFIELLRQRERPEVGPHEPLRRIMRGERVLNIADVAAHEIYPADDPFTRAGLESGRVRSILWVALVRDDAAVGAFAISRREVRPFADSQIVLLQHFAAQAVIAMENARLITETRDALERQTATAEVLQVINTSPGDLAPVFEAMLGKALRLCDAAFGKLIVHDGEGNFHSVAERAIPEPYSRFLAGKQLIYGPGTGPDQLLKGAELVHSPDLSNEEPYRAGEPNRRALVELGGARTSLQVPLRKDSALLGIIDIYRQEVRLFSDKQVALVQNFAAQAVIAMENARLITETREALEQQTATAEVLQVINSSPGDLAPVFDAMLGKAMRLCEAAFGVLWTYDGEEMHVAAQRGVPIAFAEFLARGPQAVGSNNAQARMIRGEPMVHIADVADDEAFRTGDPVRRALVELGGGRTMLAVPLRKDKAFLGSFVIYRQEVKPFSDKQTALLQNFAAQAVIAMENARLITETREALEQQTATADVLRIINSSPGELAPVFHAILEKAHSLCAVTHGSLQLYRDGKFRAVASQGLPEALERSLRQGYSPGPNHPTRRLLEGQRFAQTDDWGSIEDPIARVVELSGIRTTLYIPLRKDEALLGYFSAARQEVKPFTENEIALLESFAAQAVIAMENGRLITETREALDQQTATAEVLRVISGSMTDVQPVFEAIIARAAKLCEAEFSAVARFDDDGLLRLVAVSNLSADEAKAFHSLFPRPPTRGFVMGRAFVEAHTVHVEDVLADPGYDPRTRAILQSLTGYRTFLGVPILRDGNPIGVIGCGRRAVRPFTPAQIDLVTTFADQAVIAIENARLFDELRARQAELARSVDELTATGDVLKIISRSSVDLETVLDALVETVARLCHADQAQINRRRDGLYHFLAGYGFSDEAKAFFLTHPIAADRGTVTGRVELKRRAVHIPDVTQDRDYTFAEAAKVTGARTILGIPLLREDALIGIFIITRARVAPFTTKEIELATTFADQAVIAIENARLFDELRERQAELRVTFDNMGDGVAMFDGQQRLAAWNSNFQQILDMPDALLAKRLTYADYLRILAERGEFGTEDIEAELHSRLQHTARELRLERTRPDGRVIEVRRNPVPGGGFVLIYADITERKRAEEAIRAARDAAETALRDLQTAQASLLHAQKMAALGQLTAGIAHEIKNPLNFVNNFAGLSVELLNELKAAATPAISALDDESRAEIDETVEMLTGNLAKIAEHGRRADGIVKSMLAHSRGTSGDRQQVDINALVEESLNLAYHGARAQDQNFNITLERDFGAAIAPIELVPQDITRVFLNLFGNGFYAANARRQKVADARFKPTLRVTTRERDGAIEIAVRDNGIGIAPEHREKLFQPFFTTKPTGEGTGLGLSISYDIVTQEHGGTIAVDSRVGEYTEFTIRLPRAGTGARKDR
jgi:PAS domain S-box-containing protein